MIKIMGRNGYCDGNDGGCMWVKVVGHYNYYYYHYFVDYKRDGLCRADGRVGRRACRSLFGMGSEWALRIDRGWAGV